MSETGRSEIIIFAQKKDPIISIKVPTKKDELGNWSTHEILFVFKELPTNRRVGIVHLNHPVNPDISINLDYKSLDSSFTDIICQTNTECQAKVT